MDELLEADMDDWLEAAMDDWLEAETVEHPVIVMAGAVAVEETNVIGGFAVSVTVITVGWPVVTVAILASMMVFVCVTVWKAVAAFGVMVVVPHFFAAF